MTINNSSNKGWRSYVIPNYLKVGYKELARLERLFDLEIYIQGNLVFVKNKFKSIYG